LFILLSRAITRSRVMQIATVRNRTNNNLTHLSTFIAQSQADPGIHLFDLRPLDRSELRSLAFDLINVAPSDEVVDTVEQLSHGNPYFAIETVQQLVSSRRLVVEGTQARLTRLDSDLPPKAEVLHRFFDAGTTDTGLARLLSAFHRVSVRYLALIAEILDVDEAAVAVSFDRLAASQTLMKLDEQHYEFTHSLLRDALYDDLGPAEKRRFHGRIATFLRAERDRGMPVDVTELAIHVAESADLNDSECVSILAEAGHRASASAPLVAAQWFRRAASFLPAGDPQRANILALEARCLFLGSRPLESASAAIEALATLSDGLQRSRTLADTVNCLYIAGELRQAVELIDSEQARTGTIPLALAAQRDHFRSNLGHIVDTTFVHSDGLDALSTSDRSVVLSHDLLNASLCVDHSVAEHTAQMLADVLRDSNTRTAQSIRGTLALGYAMLGNLDMMQQQLDDYLRLTDNDHTLSIGCQIEVSRAVSLYLSGRWDELIDYGTNLLWHMKRSGTTISEARVRNLIANVLVERGDLSGAKELLADVTPPGDVMRLYLENSWSLIRLREGDVAGARDKLEQQVAAQLAIGFGESLPDALELTVEACLLLDDATAARHYADIAGQLCTESRSIFRHLPALLSRAVAFNDLDAALEAAALAERHRLPLLRGRALLLAGCIAAQPNDHLNQAFDLFESLGAVHLRQRAAAEMRARQIPRPKRQTRSKGQFTETEAAMIRLLTQGYSNKEIASMLNYSVKTVEVYLSRIYAKTDSRSRVDLVIQMEAGKFSLQD